MSTPYKIAFLGWNPFQLAHIKPLLLALPESVFFLEQRKSTRAADFSSALLDGVQQQVVPITPSGLKRLDGQVEYLVCQTPFKQLHLFSETSIALLQYGYAKEPHNYGAWRAFADVNLTYGAYASHKIAHYSPTVSVGVPRFDRWYDERFHEQTFIKFRKCIDPKRKTILYAPTWGDLSSVHQYAEQIADLANSFNVLIKLHHNSVLLERLGLNSFQNKKNLHLFGLDTDIFDLLSVADAVISDYSGAIFDAILCQKPVFLLDIESNGLLSEKMDEYSLEFASRHELGIVIQSPNLLKDKVMEAFAELSTPSCVQEVWRNRLFRSEYGAVTRSLRALRDLADGVYVPSQSHLYIRKEMRKLYTYENSKKITSFFTELTHVFSGQAK